jgi:hypothetical protein
MLVRAVTDYAIYMLDLDGTVYKDYRRNGQARYRTMTLSADEFIRRSAVAACPGLSG